MTRGQNAGHTTKAHRVTRRGDVHEYYSKLAPKFSKQYGGKVQIFPKVPIERLDDFSIWYTPGVAAVSKIVAKKAELSFEYTNRWNTICILTDGSRVLGLGNIGPEASLPVMEGKSLIYKFLGGVDAVPLPVSAHEPDKLVQIAKYLEPSFGVIHLEDISSPKCFEVLDSLRQELLIPVWHDDQQGTAGIILAGLLNALELTGRTLQETRLVFFGAGAANIATARLLISVGFRPGNLILLDSKGIIHSDRDDINSLMIQNKWKYDLAVKTNEEKKQGNLEVAAKGADVVIAASRPGPNVISPVMLRGMNKDAIVFSLANPIPEIWPNDAKKAGATIVATGRSDFPNQVNNSLMFPSIIRGILDVRSRSIPDEVIIAGARELALFSQQSKLFGKNHILPTMMDFEIYPLVAAAVGVKCVELGIARRNLTLRQLRYTSRKIIGKARETIFHLQRSRLIEPILSNK